MNEEKYIYQVQFKLSHWKEFSSSFLADTLSAAIGYQDFFQEGLNWFTREDSGDHVWYARKKNFKGGITTYRIMRRTLVTDAEVREINERKAARENQSHPV